MRKTALYVVFLMIVVIGGSLSGCDPYRKLAKSDKIADKDSAAVGYYNQKKYDRAVYLFEELVAIYRGTSRAEEMYFYYAYCRFYLGEFISASFHFEDFTEKYPNSTHAKEFEYMTAKTYHMLSDPYFLDQKYTYKAIEYYQLFLSRNPYSEHSAKCTAAIKELRDRLAKKAYEQANLYYKIGYNKAAVVAFQNMINQFPDSDLREQGQYYLVKAATKLASESIDSKRGERYNEATSAINQQMDQGQLAWCYLGHGGPKGLAQERVVKLSDIQGWSNSDKLTLLITATCSFSGYDDPSVASGGELALLNAKGGAIGLLTTTRPVYADKNKRLTSNVFKNLYARENGKALSFGEIILRAKNGTSLDTLEDNTRKFTLLGDPSQILALPEHDVVVTTINDQDATIYADTVGALDKIKLGGEIRDYTGALLSGFSGEVFVTLFDKATELKTLGNDEDSYEKSFNQYRNIIFKGRASAVNGKFEIEFILPKDINYQLGNGRISIYAHNALTDAAGHYDRLTIGGSSNTAVNDDEAPEMALFMNDEEFVFGGITDANPKLLIKLADDNGINITGNSIGHDITARITGPDFDEEVILNEYYTAAANNYKQGEVRYPLSKLAPGVYKVTAKAWDIANNSVEGETEFRVVETRNEKLHRVYNYPNPFTDNTEFSFEHDLAGLDVEIELKIYTINGRLVKSVSERRIAEGYRISMFEWDTREDYGSNLASGVYVYQITMTAPNEGLRRDSGYQKMVKI